MHTRSRLFCCQHVCVHAERSSPRAPTHALVCAQREFNCTSSPERHQYSRLLAVSESPCTATATYERVDACGLPSTTEQVPTHPRKLFCRSRLPADGVRGSKCKKPLHLNQTLIGFQPGAGLHELAHAKDAPRTICP